MERKGFEMMKKKDLTFNTQKLYNKLEVHLRKDKKYEININVYII